MNRHRRTTRPDWKRNASVALILGVILLLACFATAEGALPEYFSFDDHQAFILMPSEPVERTQPIPWVWYAPTRVGATPNGSNTWLFEHLLESGIAIAGIDIGETYGSPEGRDVYSRFYAYATHDMGLAPKMCLLAQSRGGLMLYNWAVENPDKVNAIAGIYAAVNLESYPGLATAAPAYGMTEQELQEHLADHNPVDRLQPLADADIPIFHIHGDSDNVVPLLENSQLLLDRYTALGGSMELVIVPDKGHAEIPEFFQSPQLLDFIETHAVVPEPGTAGLLSVAAACGLFAYLRRRTGGQPSSTPMP